MIIYRLRETCLDKNTDIIFDVYTYTIVPGSFIRYILQSVSQDILIPFV